MSLIKNGTVIFHSENVTSPFIMYKIKHFKKPVQIINPLLIMICIIDFVYQVYLIFDQHMLGKTVVNIEVFNFIHDKR